MFVGISAGNPRTKVSVDPEATSFDSESSCKAPDQAGIALCKSAESSSNTIQVEVEGRATHVLGPLMVTAHETAACDIAASNRDGKEKSFLNTSKYDCKHLECLAKKRYTQASDPNPDSCYSGPGEI